MTDLERIRAFCRAAIGDVERAVAEYGVAGAYREQAIAGVCERILHLVDAFPPVTSADRVPPAFRDGLVAYASHGTEPPQPLRAMLEGDLFTALSICEASRHANDDMGAVLDSFVACAINIRETLHPSVFGSPEAVSRWMERNRK